MFVLVLVLVLVLIVAVVFLVASCLVAIVIAVCVAADAIIHVAVVIKEGSSELETAKGPTKVRPYPLRGAEPLTWSLFGSCHCYVLSIASFSKASDTRHQAQAPATQPRPRPPSRAPSPREGPWLSQAT